MIEREREKRGIKEREDGGREVINRARAIFQGNTVIDQSGQ